MNEDKVNQIEKEAREEFDREVQKAQTDNEVLAIVGKNVFASTEKLALGVAFMASLEKDMELLLLTSHIGMLLESLEKMGVDEAILEEAVGNLYRRKYMGMQ